MNLSGKYIYSIFFPCLSTSLWLFANVKNLQSSLFVRIPDSCCSTLVVLMKTLKMSCCLQTLLEVEDSLREFEQRLSELKSRTEGPRSDKISNQELLKLQVE